MTYSFTDQIETINNSAAAKSSYLVPAVHLAANGFVIRNSRVQKSSHTSTLPEQATLPKIDSAATLSQFGVTSHSQKQQRHLISGREIEDILEACRPKSRGETLPSSLVTLLQKSKPKHLHISRPKNKPRKGHNPPKEGYQLTMTNLRGDELDENEPEQRCDDLAPTQLQEWGSMNLEEIGGFMTLPPKIASSHILAENEGSMSNIIASHIAHSHTSMEQSCSDKSSPSSSFTSHFSFLRGHSPEVDFFGNYGASPALHGIQLQPSLDINLNIPLLTPTSIDDYSNIAGPNSQRSNDSLSTMANGENLSDQGQIINTMEGSSQLDELNTAPEDKATHHHKKTSVQSLRNLMTKYDSNLFSPSLKNDRKARINDTALSGALPSSINTLEPQVWNTTNRR